MFHPYPETFHNCSVWNWLVISGGEWSFLRLDKWLSDYIQEFQGRTCPMQSCGSMPESPTASIGAPAINQEKETVYKLEVLLVDQEVV